MHHIHIWPISSNENAMTAHLVIGKEDLMQFEQTKQALKHDLLHENIHHATFETETHDCKEAPCAEEMEVHMDHN